MAISQEVCAVLRIFSYMLFLMRSIKINNVLNCIIIFLILIILFAFISQTIIDSDSVLTPVETQIKQTVIEIDYKYKEHEELFTATSTTTQNPALLDEAYWILNDEYLDPSPPVKVQKGTPATGPPNYHYLTTSFGATCYPGGLSNKLFEFVSLVGIARSIRRKAFIIGNVTCVTTAARELSSYFPRILAPIEIKYLSKDSIKDVSFGHLCCTYFDVGLLKNYTTDKFISITGHYLQSFKYFHTYKKDIARLLTFMPKDIKVAEKIAKELFEDEKSHRICAHVRRRDYVDSPMHQHSTEVFTKSAIQYVRNKLSKLHKKSIVALIGDDVPWAKALFLNDTWARIPSVMSDRPTIDYAFFSRHCQSIILTASASTFGFWSAYLSSAETIYYNNKFDKNDRLKNDLKSDDFFPLEWIPLHHNIKTNDIYEIARRSSES